MTGEDAAAVECTTAGVVCDLVVLQLLLITDVVTFGAVCIFIVVDLPVSAMEVANVGPVFRVIAMVDPLTTGLAFAVLFAIGIISPLRRVVIASVVSLANVKLYFFVSAFDLVVGVIVSTKVVV